MKAKSTRVFRSLQKAVHLSGVCARSGHVGIVVSWDDIASPEGFIHEASGLIADIILAGVLR